MLTEHPKIKAKPDAVVRSLLEKITGRPFYNLSRLDLPKLLDDPNQLAPNLNAYINGFSKNVREIMERFAFEQQIARMAEKNLLYEVIKKFAAVDLSPDRVDNVQMGYVFEELIRIGAEQSNEEAGEAPAHALATGWPSGGVLSAEAGAVFGAHGMGQDTILRNLALLNVLWDGGEMAIDRRSKPSFVLRGRRLTFGLMVQPEAMRGFLERVGTLPRGTGFIALFLIAWPGSTQGTRAYRPAPEAMPQVALFGESIRERLAQPLATDAHGCLTPAVLDLSPQARAEWIRFHDKVERELGARGAFRGVRDVAAKAAENAARLAALFHVLEHGASGTIASEEIRAAACIVGWHLNEARRLLADLDTPPSLAAAIRLDAWLRNEAQANHTDRVPAKRIYQYGPNCVRDSRDLRAALAILAERGRARMEEDGRWRAEAINPALLVDRE